MNDKDKWSGHLEYLKVAITLSSAILAVAATIYSDPQKIPPDVSKFFLLLSVIGVFATLVASIVSIIFLCNYLIRSVPADADQAAQEAQQRGRKITIAAGASFYLFIASGFFLLAFFALRSFSGGGITSPIQATETVSNILKGQISRPNANLVFDGLQLKNGHYQIDYTVMPDAVRFQAYASAATGQIEWIRRQP